MFSKYMLSWIKPNRFQWSMPRIRNGICNGKNRAQLDDDMPMHAPHESDEQAECPWA